MNEQQIAMRTIIEGLHQKQDADIAQGIAVIAALNALKDKIAALGIVDLGEEIAALTALGDKMSSDNPAVQAAIDAAAQA